MLHKEVERKKKLQQILFGLANLIAFDTCQTMAKLKLFETRENHSTPPIQMNVSIRKCNRAYNDIFETNTHAPSQEPTSTTRM